MFFNGNFLVTWNCNILVCQFEMVKLMIMNIKLSKNFILQEFVSKAFWKKWGERSTWFIDQRIVESVQTLRDELGGGNH